ncbi:MAG: hypothetical protein V3V92_00085 [Candidatus Hydrothermarchaeales archaeon]
MTEKEAEPKDGKMLRIKISDLRSGVQKLNIGIPFNFIKMGISVASQMIPMLKGVNIEELTKAIEEGESGKVIELEELEKGHKIEIYIEQNNKISIPL